MKYTNAQMQEMLQALAKHLERRDVIGYAAARNTRVLREELTEFSDIQNELVKKYGEAETDEEGNPTGATVLTQESESFPAFIAEVEPFLQIEHEPALFTVPYEKAIGELSGLELLELDWMFED